MENSNILTFYRGQENVVVNEKKNFNESLFKDQYAHALLQIDQLVSKGKNDVPSIIAFCGDRGEGKTSCMETIKTMLAAFNDRDDNEVKSAINEFMQNCIVDYENSKSLKDQCDNFENVRFKVLDTIDPAFFDDDHNVIELVLGMMYREMNRELKKEKKEDKDNEEKKEKRHKIISLFHDAKLCLSQLNKGKIELYDPIDELDWLSGGLELKNKFQKLCDEFLKYYLEEKNEANRFLVISIDDIDLNINFAYEMVEQIRKYLCIPNCIVLISLNINQLIEVISNYISKQVAPGVYMEAMEMAQKYVTKLIPMEYRINMPKPYNFCDRPFKYVINDDNTKEFTSVKEAVVRLIYNKTRYLFYNNKGSVSPIVPNNLRSLRHLIGMLIAMSDFFSNEKSANNKEAGRSAPLRALSPLRTVRDSFPSHGSSSNISDLLRNTLILTLLFMCHTQITVFVDNRQ